MTSSSVADVIISLIYICFLSTLRDGSIRDDGGGFFSSSPPPPLFLRSNQIFPSTLSRANKTQRRRRYSGNGIAKSIYNDTWKSRWPPPSCYIARTQSVFFCSDASSTPTRYDDVAYQLVHR